MNHPFHAIQMPQPNESMALPLSLTGLADYSPGPAIDNATLEDVLRTPVRSLMSYLGVEARHYAIDPRTGEALEHGLGTSEMSVRAGRQALIKAGLEARAIDTLICATSTPDGRLPPLTHAVQRGLGMADLQTYDLRGGCAVAMQALTLAGALIEAGRSHRVLVTLADTLSRHYLAPLIGREAPTIEELVNALTFADGAAALVIESAGERDGLLLQRVSSRSCFAEAAHGFGVDGQGRTNHNHRAIRALLPQVVEAALTDLGVRGDGGADLLDVLIVPQANRSMLNLVRTSLSEKLFYAGHRIGNSPVPAIFRALALGVESGEIVPGRSRVGMIAVESASWTYGTAVLC